MKAYKASYNGKCISLKYEVGKTYSFYGKLIMCERGFHFCKNPKDVLSHYEYDKDFVLFEVDALGKIETGINKDKSVTDKLKVVRIIPPEEYVRLTGIKLNDDGNIERIQFDDNRYIIFKYDKFGWRIAIDEHNGGKVSCCRYTYDERGNITQESCYNNYGNEIDKIDVFKYDSKNNLICEQVGGLLKEYEYNDKNFCIKSILNRTIFNYHTYDDNDNVILTEGFNSDNVKSYSSEYKYDANGNLIEELNTMYDDISLPIQIKKHLCKHDVNGNVIEYIDCSDSENNFRIEITD